MAGGIATGQAWLLAARAIQGAGAAVSVAGVAGLIASGLLVSYLSWRWVFFVNLPIGIVVAAPAERAPPDPGRRTDEPKPDRRPSPCGVPAWSSAGAAG